MVKADILNDEWEEVFISIFLKIHLFDTGNRAKGNDWLIYFLIDSVPFIIPFQLYCTYLPTHYKNNEN